MLMITHCQPLRASQVHQELLQVRLRAIRWQEQNLMQWHLTIAELHL